jgi:polysaccharide pyruvyl transferase WcaK-like protein
VKPLKVLLGGLPLGCNNSGIEATVDCVTAILRRLQPDIEITVSSANEKEVAKRLGVRTTPLYGFAPKPRLQKFAKNIRDFDLFIWCGANGLSDYPKTALELLCCAQKQGVQTLLWAVGMDSDPKKPGEQSVCHAKAAHKWRPGAILTRWRQRDLQKRICQALKNCLLVVTRDHETALALQKCGFPESVIGADSTLLLASAARSPIAREEGIVKIAFSLSSEKPLAQPAGLRQLWTRLLEVPNNHLLLIPIDSEADYQLLDSLRQGLPHQERIQMLFCKDPASIQAAAANCDVIVSSRLTLLILAANVGTPIIGIESGSKIRNWLRIFELKPVGNVADCDFARIEEAIHGFQADQGEAFRKKNAMVYNLMRKRLAMAEEELQNALEKLKKR